MTESEFNEHYKVIIDLIAETIEEADKADEIDVDINADILSIENKAGTYVINRQSPLKEIWLSSPVSGPHHFKCMEGRWVSSKNGDLFTIISHEFGVNLKYQTE